MVFPARLGPSSTYTRHNPALGTGCVDWVVSYYEPVAKDLLGPRLRRGEQRGVPQPVDDGLPDVLLHRAHPRHQRPGWCLAQTVSSPPCKGTWCTLVWRLQSGQSLIPSFRSGRKAMDQCPCTRHLDANRARLGRTSASLVPMVPLIDAADNRLLQIPPGVGRIDHPHRTYLGFSLSHKAQLPRISRNISADVVWEARPAGVSAR